MNKPGGAIPATNLPDGMFEVVCCGYLKYEHVDGEKYKGWKYGAMIVRGNDTSDCFSILLEMPVVLPQLQQGISWICQDERCFGRVPDTFGAVWLVKEGNKFELRNGDGRFAGFDLDAEATCQDVCDLHS